MEMNREQAHDLVAAIRGQVRKCVVGQDDVVDHVVAAFIAGGHVLFEGVPGVGKTLLALALSRAFGGEFSRIQFTPDLMPSDVTGHMLFDRATSEFRVHRGPIFGNLVLADEINRAPAKTQAALLEVMQEQQVTIEGSAYSVPLPFMVVATQNPVEQEGTYPLPEAQLDRFLAKLHVGYPSVDDEARIVDNVTKGAMGEALNVEAVARVCEPETLAQIQGIASAVVVDEQVIHYAVSIARATRDAPEFSLGAGPRAAIGLVRLARAFAVMEGRDYTTPDDVRRSVLPVLRHRVSMTPALEIEGVAVDQALRRLIERVGTPRK